MIIYSRFNCRHHNIERLDQPMDLHPEDRGRAVRRMDRARNSEAWLKERIALFQTYTLPSILSQTDQKFRWIGIAHPDSPQWFLDALKSVPKMELRLHEWDVDAKEPGGHTTVNLDTDDALARNFVEEAKKIDFRGETIFPRGMRYRPMTGSWITTRSDNAHFNMVIDSELTVLDFSHGRGILPKQIVDIRQALWLEVIHERNISNRLRKPRNDTNLSAEFARQYFDLDYGRIANGS
jgi:hypothetical protein